MNKTTFSRLSTNSLKPDRMRVVFKKRNNYRQKYEPATIIMTSKQSINHSNIQLQQPEQNKLFDIKDYIRSRMKTEYNDNYRDPQNLTVQFKKTQYKNSDNKRQQQITKTVESIDRKSNQPSLNSTRKNLKTSNSNQNYLIQSSNRLLQTDFYSLDSIENEVDDFLQKRLKKCNSFKVKSDWRTDSKINQLIASLKKIKNSQNPQNENMKQVDKKIELLQKLMCQSNLESQMMKNYYFSRASKTPIKQYKNSFYNNKIQDRKTKTQSVKNIESMVKTSQSHQSYKKPQINAYKLSRYTNGFFSVDKRMQPLPRTSYGRDYLAYRGYTPIPSSKPQQIKIKLIESRKTIHSSYQQEFGPKTVEKINIKELDACKDKIKNLQIQFGKKKNIAIPINIYGGVKTKKIGSPQKLQQSAYLTNHLVSQSKRQFKKADERTPAKIKHQNLHKLKYQYKKKFNV